MIPEFLTHLGTKIERTALRNSSARRLLELVCSDRLDDVRLIECRTNEAGNCEAILVEIVVPLGQKQTVADIRTVEAVAIAFGADTAIPAAYPLRDDFPLDLPHINVAPTGFPRSLCVSDQPYEDQIRAYTAAGFLNQIRWWFERTAYGKLHGDEQPLDPIFHTSPVNIIASDRLNDADYAIGVRLSPHDIAPVVLSPLSEKQYSRIIGQAGLMTPLFVETAPVPHGQLHWLPLTLGELVQVYEAIGVDLIPALSNAAKMLVRKAHSDALMDQPTLLIVQTRIEAPDGRHRMQKKAFATSTTAGAIGEALGVIAREQGVWASLISPQPALADDLAHIEIAAADLHPHFSRELGAAASGYDQADDSTIVLAGAGALGSHLAMNLARGGVGTWHVVDSDFLLPHNQARYALEPDSIGSAKADALCLVIRRLLEDEDAAHSYVCRIDTDERSEELALVLQSASAVIDATASVPAGRYLGHDKSISGPISSAFLTPTGRDGILLTEPADRSITIDCIEMHYYWVISADEAFANHLDASGAPLPVGGCRSPSVIIPEPQVSLLSALIAGRWLKGRGRAEASILIWQGADELGTIRHTEVFAPQFMKTTIGDWTIMISSDLVEQGRTLRARHAPKETGGIIAGSWDRLRNTIYLVGLYDAPPDSIHSTTGFERGSVGVFKTIRDLEKSTIGNLTYVGEWHSHPPGAMSTPSSADADLLKWIDDILVDAEAPATMLVFGEDGCRIVLDDDGILLESSV